MKKNVIVGISSLMFANFLYGFYGILTRMMGFKLPPFFLGWTRSLFEMIVLMLIILTYRKWVKVQKKDFIWIISRGVSGGISFFGSYLAFFYTQIGLAYFIYYAGLLISGFILGYVFFKEKLNFIKIVSLIIAMSGLILIYSINLNEVSFYHVLAAFVGGLGGAVWNVFSKKISGRYSALQLNFLDNLIFFVLCLIISVLLKEQWAFFKYGDLSVWLTNLLFAMMFLVTGQLVVIGFKYVEAQIGSLMLLLDIVFGIIMAYLFFRETILLATFFGGGLIILAIILPQINFKKIKGKIHNS